MWYDQCVKSQELSDSVSMNIYFKHMIWGTGLLLYSLAGLARISAFNPAYQDLLDLSENQPQKALQYWQKMDPVDFSAARKAEHHLVASQLYGNLDYPNKMTTAAQQGLALISSKEEPWLFHQLSLALVDSWDRNGTGIRGLAKVEDAQRWGAENNDLGTRLYAMLILSQLLIQTDQYNQALQLVQEAYDLAPVEGPDLVKADFSNQMSAIYVYRDEFEIALPYLQETLAHYRKKDKKLAVSIALFELGRAHLVLDRTASGLAYLQESIQIAVAINDLQGIAYGLNELATHHLSLQEYDKAESYLQEARQRFNEAGNQYMLFDNNIQLSQLYTQTKQYGLAEQYLTTAAQQVDPQLLPFSQIAIQRQQANILDARGQHEEAYDLLTDAVKQLQELEAQQSAEKLHQIRAIFEVESSEQENQLLAQKNQLQQQQLAIKNQQNILLMLFLVSALLLVLFLIYFTYKFRRQSVRLHELANYDELTGLRNRSNTIYAIKHKLKNLDKEQPMYLVMIDLDYFKDINDRFGHALGDKVLKIFGDYCRDVFSENDLAGRVGGEEFLVCLTGYTPQQAFDRIEKLRQKTAKMHHLIKAPDFSVTLSAGLCQITADKPSFHQWVKCADKALYQAKHAGRNQTIAADL